MKAPVDSVSILSISFHLIGKDDLKEDESIFGDCDTAQERIRYATDDDISARQIKLTICHELEHKINALLGIEASDTEPEVQSRGLALYTLIKDNEDLVKWIGNYK